jgi:FAD/FMN-containing dehydrogenase
VVIPLPRMAEYTDGIERINIELSCATSSSWPTRWRPSCKAASRWARPREPPPPELLHEKVELALDVVRQARTLWQGWLRDVELLFPSCRTTACAPAGRRRSAPAAGIFTGSDFEPLLAALGEIQQRVLKGRVWWPCTCTPATATCTPTSRQQRQLRDAADRARGGGPHHAAGAQPGRRDLAASTASASPSWSS